MKVLHIANDEKFIDGAIELFGYNEHNYLINSDSITKLKFVNSRNKNIFTFKYHSSEYYEFISNFKPDLIFFHNLSVDHKRILLKIGSQYKVYLYCWGLEMYSDTPKLKNRLYKTKTKKIKQRIFWNHFGLRFYLGTFFYYLTGKYFREIKFKNCLPLIDYIGTVEVEEYNLFKTTFGDLTNHIKYIPFNYYLKYDFSFSNVQVIKNNILIGNSANYDNNHLDTFDIIAKNTQVSCSIYVPLSYGGDQFYISIIKEKGYDFFGNKFIPICDFQKLEDYYVFISSIKIALMNHSHQHGMGNIIFLLFQGVKVYMDPINTSYKFLKDKGFKVFDINLFNETFAIELTVLEKEHNKRMIENIYGLKELKFQANMLLSIIQNEINA
jgi:hypothetical protein